MQTDGALLISSHPSQCLSHKDPQALPLDRWTGHRPSYRYKLSFCKIHFPHDFDSVCGRQGLVAFPTTNFKLSVLNSLENNLPRLYFWFWMSPFITYIGANFKPSVLNSLENNLPKLYFGFWMSPFMTYIGGQMYKNKLLVAERQQNSFKLGAKTSNGKEWSSSTHQTRDWKKPSRSQQGKRQSSWLSVSPMEQGFFANKASKGKNKQQ